LAGRDSRADFHRFTVCEGQSISRKRMEEE
jgi:hypothetical protein